MRFGMPLRVVQDRKIVLQISGPESRLTCKSVVGAEARHEPVTANRFNAEARIDDRQRHDRRVNLSQEEFLDKLNGIAMRGPDRATWDDLLVHLARHAKQFRIDKGSASEVQCTDLAVVDRYQRGNGFIARIQHSLGNRFECDAGFGELDAPIL
jgi:hypothetical protein